MKIRHTGDPDAPVRAEGAIVVCDEYHRRTVGLAALADRCFIVEDLGDAGAVFDARDEWASATLIDTRPEIVDRFLDEFAPRIEGRPGGALGILFPRQHGGLVMHLVTNPRASRLAISTFRIGDELIQFELVPAAPSDGDAEVFFRGFRLGSSLATSRPGDDPGDESAALRERLIATLEAFDLVGTSPETRSSGELATIGAGAKTSDLDEAERRTLENRIVTLTGHLDTLQRKYDALANSRLGRITLNSWARKKKEGTR